MAAIGSIQQSYTPGPNDLIYGRDIPLNDRVALNQALWSSKKSVFFPCSGEALLADGPVYGFGDCQFLYGIDRPPLPNQRDTGGQPKGAIAANFNGGPTVFLGNQNNFGIPAAGTYIGLGSYLDSSVSNSANMYGIRTFGGKQRGAFLGDGFQLAGSGTNGDCWTGMAYTVSFAMLPYNGGNPANPFTNFSHLIGGTDFGQGNTNPFYLVTGPESYFGYGSSSEQIFSFYATDANGNTIRVAWPYPTTVTGLIRIYILFDFNRSQFSQNVTVYMNSGSGPQLVTTVELTPGTAGVGLPPNFYAPFTFGYFSTSTNACNSNGTWDDWVMSGLHIEAGLTYKDNGSGTLITQSGAAITDQFAFFSPRSTTSALLPLTQNSTATFPWEIPQNNGYGFLYSLPPAGATFTGSGLSNMTIIGSTGGNYGDAVQIGQSLDQWLVSCSFNSGSSAIRANPVGSNQYYVTCRDIQCAGSFALNLCNTDILIENLETVIGRPSTVFAVGIYGRSANIRMNRARFVTVNQGTKNLIWLDGVANNPNSLTLTDFNNDNEGQAWPYDSQLRLNNTIQVAIKGMSCSPTASKPPTPISVPFVTFGPQGANLPGPVHGYAEIGNVTAYGAPAFHRSTIRVEDPKWSIKLTDAMTNVGLHGAIHDVSAGCVASIEHMDVGTLPPRWGRFYAGKHEVKCSPPAGGYAEWRCVSSGFYGTPTIPVWQGFYPNLVPNSNACAAYCIGSIAASGSAVQYGTLGDSFANIVVKTLFGDTVYSPPGSAYFGFLSTYLTRNDLTGSTQTFLDGAEQETSDIQVLSVTNPGDVTGGTFTITLGSNTTAALAYNATGSEIAAAIAALPGVGTGNIACSSNQAFNATSSNPNTFQLTFQGTLCDTEQTLMTINTASLTGSGFSASIAKTQVGGGYVRQAATFPVASNGSTTLSAAIAFPTSTNSWNKGYPIILWMLGWSGSNTEPIFIGGELTSSFTIGAASESAPGYAASSLALQYVPSNLGGLTYFAADQILNYLTQATALAPPATWYIGLSSTPINSSGSGLTEPSGSGYARVAVANTTSQWNYNAFSFEGGTVRNTNAITFPTPTAAWSSGVSLPYWFLADAATGGNIWASGTIPVAPVVSGSTSTAPSFAPGAFTVQLI